MYAVIDMLNDVVLILIVSIDLEVEGDVVYLMIYFWVDYGLLVSADAVMMALIPYSLSMGAFWAP